MQSGAPAERNCSDLCVLLAFLFCFVLESEALIHRDFLYIYIYIRDNCDKRGISTF